MIDRSLWGTGFALDAARASAARGDACYVWGFLFRCAACLVQALYASNERYFVNEKGSFGVAGSFALGPAGFGGTISGILARTGDAEQPRQGIARLEGPRLAVQGMCAEAA